MKHPIQGLLILCCIPLCMHTLVGQNSSPLKFELEAGISLSNLLTNEDITKMVKGSQSMVGFKVSPYFGVRTLLPINDKFASFFEGYFVERKATIYDQSDAPNVNITETYMDLSIGMIFSLNGHIFIMGGPAFSKQFIFKNQRGDSSLGMKSKNIFGMKYGLLLTIGEVFYVRPCFYQVFGLDGASHHSSLLRMNGSFQVGIGALIN